MFNIQKKQGQVPSRRQAFHRLARLGKQLLTRWDSIEVVPQTGERVSHTIGPRLS
jgi:hypothetical protein